MVVPVPRCAAAFHVTEDLELFSKNSSSAGVGGWGGWAEGVSQGMIPTCPINV